MSRRGLGRRLYGDALGALAACRPAPRTGLPPTTPPAAARDGAVPRLAGGRLLGLPLDAPTMPARSGLRPADGSALGQPRVCVHRDYHSRNLMVAHHRRRDPGFPGCVSGRSPTTSCRCSGLLCPLARQRVDDWDGYFELAVQSGVLDGRSRAVPALVRLMAHSAPEAAGSSRACAARRQARLPEGHPRTSATSSRPRRAAPSSPTSRPGRGPRAAALDAYSRRQRRRVA